MEFSGIEGKRKKEDKLQEVWEEGGWDVVMANAAG